MVNSLTALVALVSPGATPCWAGSVEVADGEPGDEEFLFIVLWLAALKRHAAVRRTVDGHESQLPGRLPNMDRVAGT